MHFVFITFVYCRRNIFLTPKETENFMEKEEKYYFKHKHPFFFFFHHLKIGVVEVVFCRGRTMIECERV